VLDKIRRLFSIKLEFWTLQGYDTFAGEWYDLPGRYPCESAARIAARWRLKELEKLQPSRESGGQAPGGIQDRVYVVAPDGTMYRYLPDGQQEQ